jgi:hypothetical protein
MSSGTGKATSDRTITLQCPPTPRPHTIVAQRLQRFEIIGGDDDDDAAARLSSLKVN